MNKSQNLHNDLNDFKRSVEITRDVRFQANLRLSRRQRGSSYIISFLSLTVIAISLIPNFIQIKPYQNQIILACSIILSVFVIFTSLIDGSQNFYHQGWLLHQCARKVANIYYELKNIDVENDQNSEEKFHEIQKKYSEALDSCPINHDIVDFYAEIARKPHLFPNEYGKNFHRFKNFCYKLKSLILSYSWLFPSFSILFIIFLIIYRYVILGIPV